MIWLHFVAAWEVCRTLDPIRDWKLKADLPQHVSACKVQTSRQPRSMARAIYRWESEKHSDLSRSSVVSRDLQGLVRRIKRLDEGLENLPDGAVSELSKAISKCNMAYTAKIITDALPDDAPSLTIPIYGGKGPLTALSLELSDFRQVLSGFENAAERALDALPKRLPGQSRDHGLRLWMHNIEDLWTRTTQVPFTRDQTQSGEPITPAAVFCVAAFLHVTPDYSKSRILGEMKDCIRTSRRRTGGYVAKNDP
jgi:hypothetical protein